MLKYEMKVEISDQEKLNELIETSYTENGRLTKKGTVTLNGEHENYSDFKNLDGNIVKLSNQDLIIGTLRCIVVENENSISLKPVSMYYVKQDGKYSFY
jgi:hypothetical protein